MRRGRVLVVGSVNCDVSVRAPRLPRPGETVLGSASTVSVGGKGFTQAAAADAIGAVTRFVGAVGKDPFGERVVGRLMALGFDTAWLKTVEDIPTGVAAITVDDDGTNAIAVAPGANAAVDPAQVGRALESMTPDVLLVQLEIPVPVTVAALAMARERGITTVLNPAPADPAILDHLKLVDILTPNEHELSVLTGMSCDDILADGNSFEQAVRQLQGHGGGIVVVTRGERGCAAFDGRRFIYLPAFAVETVDTTGAGDVFNGALAAAIAAGIGLAEAMEQASAAAAISTTRRLAEGSAPDMDEVLALMAGKVSSGENRQCT